MRKYTILLTVLLLILLAIPAFAAPVDGVLTVGQTVVTNVKPYGQENYSFTPTTSGDYAVCMEETGANFQKWVCLDGNVEVPGRYYVVAGWEGKVFFLTAGKTYTIRVTHDTGFGGTLPRKMRLEKVTAAMSVSIHSDHAVYYPGEEFWLKPVLPHPGAVSGSFHWSSSNPAVARIEDSIGTYTAVVPLAPGKSTITLTLDGLTATYELNVVKPQQIPIDGSVEVTLDPGERVNYTFTPTESGKYVIWHIQQECTLFMENLGIGEHFYGVNGRGEIHSLQAGMTYQCMIANYTPEAVTRVEKVSVEKVRPVESVTLTGQGGLLPEGFQFFLEAQVDPICGILEGVQWSCSDPDVLKLEHMDSNSAICQATVLKEGKATVTVTVGSICATWEYGLPVIPNWQPDQTLPLWDLGTTVTMPLLKSAGTDNIFKVPEDGYYRFTVTADQETFLTVWQEGVNSAAWHNEFVVAGEESVVQVYLYKDHNCRISNTGSLDGGGTLTGRVERLQVSDKPVDRIEITGKPTYEFGNDDYGALVDRRYIFNPLGFGHMPGLVFTVFYTDGTSATVTEQQLVWNIHTESGLPGCTWDGRPVEICLLDGTMLTDSLWLTGPETVQARVRYMGVCAQVSLTVGPAHAHDMVYIPHREPTRNTPGTQAHYRCRICEKYYDDEQGTIRIQDPETLILQYKKDFVVDQNQAQDILQQVKPGENVGIPIPDGVVQVELPAQVLQEIVNRESTLELVMDQTIVQVDSAALAAILAQGTDAQVVLQVDQVTAEILKPLQQQALGSREVLYILSAQVQCGGNSIHDFGGGKVTFQVPFTPKPGMGYRVIYVAEDGAVTPVPCTYHNGMLTFSTGHFSEYAIVKDPTAPPLDASGFDYRWVLPVVGVVAVCAVAVLWIRKRRKNGT